MEIINKKQDETTQKEPEKQAKKPQNRGKKAQKTAENTQKEAQKEPEKQVKTPQKRGRKPKNPPKTDEKKPEEPKKEIQKEEIKKEEKKPSLNDFVFLGKAEKPEEPKKEEPKQEEAKKDEKKETKAVIPVKPNLPAKKPALPEFAFLGNSTVSEKPKAPEPKAEPKPEAKPEPKQEIKPEVKPEPKQEPKPEAKPEPKQEVKTETKPQAQPQRQQAQTQQKQPQRQNGGNQSQNQNRGRTQPQKTRDELLKERFISRLHSLDGSYFEYYSVYLLERYSLKNGRRLEGLKISGGTADGGIDGEIELTDKFGFRETIYIQSKNWDPTKGDPEKWQVGETLLQQFIGAATCRMAKEGKAHCRGIFVTTSRFTEGAKALLESVADRFIGYDENDVFEAAKECSFGLKQKNGEWVLDDDLLSGSKAFFSLM